MWSLAVNTAHNPVSTARDCPARYPERADQSPRTTGGTSAPYRSRASRQPRSRARAIGPFSGPPRCQTVGVADVEQVFRGSARAFTLVGRHRRDERDPGDRRRLGGQVRVEQHDPGHALQPQAGDRGRHRGAARRER